MADNPIDRRSLTATSVARPLSRRYLVVLVCVAVLVLVDQAILQPMLMQLNFAAPAINLAGRQRMLSQKISKAALALERAVDEQERATRRRELAESLRQWTAAHQALASGDTLRGIPAAPDEVAESLRAVEPLLSEIEEAASELLRAEPAAQSGASPAQRILQVEPRYLSGMEHAVALLESAARSRVATLRACAAGAMVAILLLLVGLYFLVLQPAARLISTQVEQLVASDEQHRQLAAMLREARDGLELRVEARTSELRTANAALQREMSERQMMEARMRSLSADLAHASRVNALGELATGLAHEINQPLATLTNCAGTLELELQSDRAAGDVLQLAGQIKQAALRAGAIVRRMRSFVRRGEVKAAPVDLNLLVVEVLELCGPELRQAEVRSAVECAGEPALVSADAVQIQQVLVNLVQNALGAMREVAPQQRELRLTVVRGRDEITVSIADSGPGLPAELLERGFSTFQSSKRDGLGLGLAISRTLIEQHQGRFWIGNREQGGAVASFCLPRLEQHDTGQYQHPHCVCG